MEAFYISMIFLGVLLVIGALFFIAMDKVNGKDFFKEFDRKKEEMFDLIQESEEMVQELNRMSDYVVTVISEKNQEFFDRMNRYEASKNTQRHYTEPSQIKPQIVNAPHLQNSVPYMPKGVAPKPVIPGGAYYNDAVKKVEIKDESEKAADNFINDKVETVEQNNTILNKEQVPVSEIQEVKKSEVASDQSDKKIENQINKQYQETKNNYKATDNNTHIVLDSRRREVLQMIDQGMSNDEIAVKLKIGKGEIGLIRGLSK